MGDAEVGTVGGDNTLKFNLEMSGQEGSRKVFFKWSIERV